MFEKEGESQIRQGVAVEETEHAGSCGRICDKRGPGA